MWIIFLLVGLLLWMVAGVTRQLATSRFGRNSAHALYVLVWACFIVAGIDIARTYNLYAPLLAMCGVLMFYATIGVLHSDALERYTVFKLAACCFAAGIALLIGAIINFAAWIMRSGLLIVVAALATSGCGGKGDDVFFVVLLLIGIVIAFILGMTAKTCWRCGHNISQTSVDGLCDECRKRV